MNEHSATHWSLLLRFGDEGERAWTYFYETYRPAVRALFRRLGVPESDADDLVQQFFATALERDFLAKADPVRGHFRGYLRTAAERFLTSEWRKAGRAKRSPEKRVKSLEDPGEGRPVLGEAPLPPDEVFDRAWARALFESAKKRAKETLEASGKARHFEAFVLRTEGELDWTEIGTRLEAGAEMCRKWVERVKARLARYVKEAIGCTVDSAEDLAREIAYLSGLLEE